MTARPRYPRTSCAVPFCRRTSTLFKNEWLCGVHWRLVDRWLKRFRTRRLKAIANLIAKYEAELRVAQAALPPPGLWTPEYAVAEAPVLRAAWKASRASARWQRIEGAIWRRMKAQAIERAAGAPI